MNCAYCNEFLPDHAEVCPACGDVVGGGAPLPGRKATSPPLRTPGQAPPHPTYQATAQPVPTPSPQFQPYQQMYVPEKRSFLPSFLQGRDVGKPLILGLIVIFILVLLFVGKRQALIKQVQSATPERYPSISYGQLFEKTMENRKWTTGKDKDGDDTVIFRGNFPSGIPLMVEFWVSDFVIMVSSLEIDGEKKEAFEAALYIMVLFEAYQVF